MRRGGHKGRPDDEAAARVAACRVAGESFVALVGAALVAALALEIAARQIETTTRAGGASVHLD